jgi:hypothetical protein
LFLFAPVGPAAALPFVEVWGEFRYWRPILESSIVASAPGFPENPVDPVSDLGLDKEQNAFEGRVGLTLLGRHKFRIGYLPLSFDGDRTVTRDIIFGGTTFTATVDRVLTDLDVKILQAGYEFDFLKTPVGYLGVLFEIHYFDVEAHLRTVTSAKDESADFKFPFPAVGLAFRAYPITRILSVGAEVVGVTIGSKGHFLDGEASVTLSPWPFVELTGGYRVIDLHGEEGDDSFDLRLHGPFASLTVRF